MNPEIKSNFGDVNVLIVIKVVNIVGGAAKLLLVIPLELHFN